LAALPPTKPIYPENKKACHSERSEESKDFYRTTVIDNVFLVKIKQVLLFF